MSLVDPLYRAISEGDCQRICEILAGRDVNIGTGRDNLLRFALMGLTDAPNPDVIRLLIKLGVDVNSKDQYGWTPLHYAARTKSPAADPSLSTACVKLLIDAGADVNAEDNEEVTPLHRSILRYPWNVDMIEALLAAGAKKTAAFSSFMKAVAGPDKDKVLELLDKYA
jgi:ankyrin repeat protein